MSLNAEETSESGRIGMKADEGLSEKSPALSGLFVFELNSVWPEKCRIKNIGTVYGCHNCNPCILLEAVHLNKNL